MGLKDLSHRMDEVRRLTAQQREREEAEKEATRLRMQAYERKLTRLRDETLRPFLERCIEELWLRDPSFDLAKEWFEVLDGSQGVCRAYTNLITLFFTDPFASPSKKPNTVIDYTVTIGTWDRELKNVYAFCGRGSPRKAGTARLVERASYKLVGESPLEAITTEKLEEMIEAVMNTLFPEQLVHEWR